jgi:hypothetical protein
MKILFFSPKTPSNIVTLTHSLGFSSSSIKPNQAGTVTAEDLTEKFRTLTRPAVCIDAHFGPADMQYFRELCSLEDKGIAPIRKKILMNHGAQAKDIPVSVTLLQMIRITAPTARIVFLTHKKVGPNVKAVLRELGALAVIANDDSLKEQTLAFSELLKNAKAFGNAVVEGATDVIQAGKKFVQTFHAAGPGDTRAAA